jgi:hypothetical protein
LALQPEAQSTLIYKANNSYLERKIEMALFKISKGSKANLPTTLTEGFCWYTYDDSKFYIDHKDENGVLVRKALNAQDAETLTGASLATILTDSDIEIPTSHAVFTEINKINNTIGTDDNLLGTWVFNDELSILGNETIIASMLFTVQGDTGEFTGFISQTMTNGILQYRYRRPRLVDETIVSDYVSIYQTDELWGMPKGWVDETNKTITITKAPTDETFITWLKANATKTSGQTIFDRINNLAPVAASGLIDDLSVGEDTELIFDGGTSGFVVEVNEAGGSVLNITDLNEILTTEDNAAGGQTAIID